MSDTNTLTTEQFREMIGSLLDEKLKAQTPVDVRHNMLPLAGVSEQKQAEMSPGERAKKLMDETFSFDACAQSGAFFTPAMKDAGYRANVGEWFKAVVRPSEQRTDLQHAITKTAMSTTDGVGGYTVPPGFVAEILYRAAFYSPIFDIVGRLPMGSSKLQMPVGANAFTVYWPGEGTAITESNATFTQFTLSVNPQGALARFNRLLVEASGVDILGWVRDRLAESIAVDSENKIVNGNGSSCPTGFADSSYSSIASVSMASSALAYGDLVSLYYALDPKYWGGAVWLLNSTAAKLIDSLTTTAGAPVMAHTPGGALAFGDKPYGQPQGMMLGKPFYIVPSISAAYGSSSAYTTRIYFGNFKDCYQVGELNSMRIETSTEAGADTFAADQMLLKVIRYWDGKVADQRGIKYLTGVI